MLIFTIILMLAASSVTNEAVKSEEGPKIRELTVPSIYEVRNMQAVTSTVDMALFANDIFLRKLEPVSIVSGTSTSSIETNAITEADVKDLTIATADAKDLTIAEADTKDLTIAEADTKDLTIQEMVVKSTEVKTVSVGQIEVVVNPSVYELLQNMKEEVEFSREYTKYGYENAAYLRDLDALDDWSRYAWIKILKECKTSGISYLKNPKRDRIMAEVRLESNTFDRVIYEQNLDCVKRMGYDAVLVRFDCSENFISLTNAIGIAKEKGLAIYGTYVGLDNQKPNWNPFCSTYMLEHYFQSIAPMCKGWLLNWRSTSAHVKLLPKEFYNYICKLVRTYNPGIYVYGEVYYGKIMYLNHQKSLIYTAPENVSGLVINNMGYSGYNHVYVANRLFSKAVPNYNKLEKMGQVIGYAPYYCSKDNLNMTLSEEYNAKFDVEKSFRSANCSTVTMLHDGIDDNYVIEGKYETCDNIMTDKKLQLYAK